MQKFDENLIKKLKFDDKGLIPAIIIDANSNEVLTLAYMNEESLKISLEKRLTCFYSRSRQELWLKGETSGNYQHILEITADCDFDSLLIKVIKDGPACHTGSESCFTNSIFEDEENKAKSFSLQGLYELLEDRKIKKPEGSYTSYLFEKGLDKILKKVGEESTEVIIAAKDNDHEESIYEIADLTYHIMTLMVELGISVDEIKNELGSRHIIDHKIKQEKMTK